MSAVVVNEVRPGVYMDSVALMRLSRDLSGLDGVEEASLMMGTPANRGIMRAAGILDSEGEAAAGGDLVIAIRAVDPASADRALSQARALLDQPSAAAKGSAWRPRSLRAAVEALPSANLALISVPGDFAAAEARKALARGLHVMMFSDNVSLEDEIALKRMARARGLLMMGPDCGTAIIAGQPLAFANQVPRGAIGLIGASGTGTQEVTCLIAQGGGGVSHAIGVGGRDLKEPVGALSTLMAMDALDADPATERAVLVSKPPGEAVMATLKERLAASPMNWILCLIGAPALELPANCRQAHTLEDAARLALGQAPAEQAVDRARVRAATGARIRGLFAGGTLCAEAQVILRDAGEALMSNAPIAGVGDLESGSGHRLLDLGEDQFTRGRPHPMIDPSVRDLELSMALDDPTVGVILLDLVLGHGAHDDPAGHLIHSLGERGREKPVVVSVTGTGADPQGLSGQRATLTAAGLLLADTNAQAARLALACLKERGGG